MNYEMTVDDIKIIRDNLSWEEKNRDLEVQYDIRNIVVLKSQDKELVLYTDDISILAIEMYETEDILNEKYEIHKRWAISKENDELADDVIYKRTIEKL